MRYAKTQKAATRMRVIEAAASALRRDGIDGIGVAGLMGEVGLTKGGFYAHFESKDDLVAEAVSASLIASADRMRATGEAAKVETRSPLTAIVDAYLSQAHAGTPAAGCTIGALLSDLARSPRQVRSAAAGGAAQLAAVIEQTLPDTLGSARASRARAILGTLAGCLQLARLEADADAREAVLASARDAIRHLAEHSSSPTE